MPDLWKNKQNKAQKYKTKKVHKSGAKYKFENCSVQEKNLLKIFLRDYSLSCLDP